MMAQKILLESLNDLSSDELNQFKSLIELEESFPLILRGRLKMANTDETVDLMVKTFSGKCVNMTETVLKKMNRTDLVQRLSDISSGTKEEPLPPLIQSVETMACVIELLQETLKDLSDQDLQRFQMVLNKIQSDKGYPNISPRWLMMSDSQDMVFSLVQDHSQHSLLEMTTEAFERMNRTDLVQRLSQSSSGPKKKHSEAQRSAVIQKVAKMAAVKHLLLETLNDLRNEDLEKFKQTLDLIVSKKKPRLFSWILRSSTGRAQTVEQMMGFYGQQCVEITMEVLKDINTTDLMQRFTNLELKEMYSVDEHRPAQSEGAQIAAVKPILLKTLKDLSDDERYRFQWYLHFTFFQKSISYSFHGYPNWTASASQLVDQMVEICGPQSVEVTREVLMDLNRSDLVERLSETILRLKEEPLPSVIQSVETMASVIELLLETLKDLSDQDLQSFQRVLIEIQSGKGYPDISPSWHMMSDRQDMVFYLVQDHSQHSLLEMTTEAFERMNRTDLVQRLSQSSSGPKKKHSEAQRPAVIQKVATMAAVKHLLLETLNDLRNEDLEKFKQTLDLIVSKKKPRYFPLIWSPSAGRAQTVEQMMEIFGQQCVEITMEVLKDINRTDLRQRFTNLELKEMYSVDEHRPAQSEGAQIAAEKEILLKTLKDLSDDELDRFQWLLQFTFFQKSISYFCYGYPNWTASASQLVDQMVETCGPQSVEVTTEVLMDLNRSDLVERLSETILRLKEKPLPSVIQSVETMASVIELLLETLKDLSDQDLQSFQRVLIEIQSDKGYPNISPRRLMMRDRQDMVFYLSQDHSQHRLLEMTTEAFEKMNRTDLVQRLSKSSSGPKKKHSDEQRPAVIQKVATMAAVKHLLLETLNDLRNEDLEKFKQTLDLIVSKKKPRYVSWILRSSTGRAQTVEQIIQIFGQQCVEITMEVLKDINRTDLRQRLTKPSSELKEMYSVDEHRPAQSEGAQIAAVKLILLKTLKDLSGDELDRFQWYLQFTYFQKSISYFCYGYPYWTESALRLVDQMVETCGPQSVEVTREVLMDMKTSDPVERLSETILRLKDKHPSKPLNDEVTVASLEEKLLETLEDLSDGELENFKRGLQRISSQRLETAGSQQSMEVTMEILKKMKEDDYGLEQMLSNITLGSKGPSRSLELEGSEKMMKDSSGWNKLEPQVNSTDEDEPSTYSLKSEAGNFECSVSGLRWVCQEKVSFKYQFCSSEEPMKRMEMMKYMPAGPLIDIKVISGKLFEVYLPHWICIDDIPKILQKFAVLHIDDCGDVVEKVSEVTSSHVKLSEPVFSPRAVLMKMGFPVKIHCNVLIYSKAYASCTVLHVYLIPLDPALKE
ncbi:NACHT LRR and PYD domains-containing protein 1 like, partial [Dissostichus eleginoides]